VQALKDGSLQPRTLQALGTLVLDEADLLLSFGYEDDLRQLQPLVRDVLRRGRNAQCPYCSPQPPIAF
jgi:superfamily II DNA/RNA helicase